MIKVSELKDTGKPGYRISEAQVGGVITLDLLKQLFVKTNDEMYGLPVSVSKDQLKSGGLMNSTIEDCLVITNTAHPTDYFKYCITLKKQGKMAFICLNYYGSSVLTGKMHKADERKKSGSLSGMLLNAISGPNEAAYDEEYNYYDMIENIFSEICE